MEEEKFGRAVIDGKIVDLDNATADELEEYVKLLTAREKELEDKIDDILDR
jgi:hypothetical protein